MKRAILVILVCGCLGVMGFSAYKILSQMNEYRKGDETYEKLEENIRVPEEESGEAPEGEALVHAWDGSSENRELMRMKLPEVDFDALKAQNPDIVGWLYCEDTRINYPVVQGPDNDYYLHRMFTGEYNYAGCLFLESINARDLSDFNSIIYGHHMRNGSMFHDLVNFKDQEFFEAHPYVIFLTPEKNYVMEVFAGFVSAVTEDSWKIGFGDELDRQKWLEWVQDKSDFKAPFTPAVEDHLLTLSTCSYEFNNARYVLYGILTEVLPLED